MGDVISLNERRRVRTYDEPHHPQARGARATFFFDLALPATYLAVERVDRSFAGVRWEPVYADALFSDGRLDDAAHRAGLIEGARERATRLGAPLVWPERFPINARPAMRAAALACEHGRGAAFVLAACRLAFCGGFDLHEPEVLAEVAAAAGLSLDAVLSAAGDPRRDAPIEQAGVRLRAMAATDLPAIHVGRRLFSGEERLGEALAYTRAVESPRFHRPHAG